jgi:DNA-directed RNA polymerase II subunit RPB2
MPPLSSPPPAPAPRPPPAAAPPAARSQLEGSNRTSSGMAVKMLGARGVKGTAKGSRGVAGSVIRVSLPYVKADVPVLILFRALGCVSDREILEHIVYDW